MTRAWPPTPRILQDALVQLYDDEAGDLYDKVVRCVLVRAQGHHTSLTPRAPHPCAFRAKSTSIHGRPGRPLLSDECQPLPHRTHYLTLCPAPPPPSEVREVLSSQPEPDLAARWRHLEAVLRAVQLLGSGRLGELAGLMRGQCRQLAQLGKEVRGRAGAGEVVGLVGVWEARVLAN